jgi:general secretion pathway protein G
LLELLVVMVIIGLLAGIVAPQYFAQIGKSNTKVARAQIESFGQALDQYRLDVGQYPTSEQGLIALRLTPQQVVRWQGPYLKRDIPEDPWGHPYVYRRPGQHGEYDIVSLGADGQPGGEGEAADVSSW